jgi:AcrR family transcriptional regulator
MAPPTAITDRRARRRLNRNDWLSQAWEAFVSGGIGAVSVNDLARQLDVTRGSFYHHFADRHDLLQELLRYWEENWTLRVREDVRALDLDPSETLLVLARVIRERGASRHDVRMRAWALEDPAVREIVRQVDEERLEFIRSQFDAIGFDQLEAESRARQFLYYEMAEPAVLAEQSPELEEKLLLARHALLTASDSRTA